MTDINAFYTYGSSAWLLLQGGVLAFFPAQLSHFYLTSSITTHAAAGYAAQAVPGQQTTDSAFTILRIIGGFIMLVAIAAFAVKPSRPPSQLPSPREPQTPLTTTIPRQLPGLGAIVLPMTMGVHASAAVYSYTRYMTENVFAWQLLMVASTFWLFTGIFALLFSGEVPVSDGAPGMGEGKKSL